MSASSCCVSLDKLSHLSGFPPQSNVEIELSQCFSKCYSINHSVKQNMPQDVNICYSERKKNVFKVTLSNKFGQLVALKLIKLFLFVCLPTCVLCVFT